MSPLYKMTFDTTFSTLGWASSSTPYRLGAQLIYPFVQPVADPAFETVNKSKVVHQVRTKHGRGRGTGQAGQLIHPFALACGRPCHQDSELQQGRAACVQQAGQVLFFSL